MSLADLQRKNDKKCGGTSLGPKFPSGSRALICRSAQRWCPARCQLSNIYQTMVPLDILIKGEVSFFLPKTSIGCVCFHQLPWPASPSLHSPVDHSPAGLLGSLFLQKKHQSTCNRHRPFTKTTQKKIQEKNVGDTNLVLQISNLLFLYGFELPNDVHCTLATKKERNRRILGAVVVC